MACKRTGLMSCRHFCRALLALLARASFVKKKNPGMVQVDVPSFSPKSGLFDGTQFVTKLVT